jgi:hypothetical protein
MLFLDPELKKAIKGTKNPRSQSQWRNFVEPPQQSLLYSSAPQSKLHGQQSACSLALSHALPQILHVNR